MELSKRIQLAIRDVPDFPKKGILFKDITPILADPVLVKDILLALAAHAKHIDAEVVAGIESRGFWFGPLLAQQLGVPFVPLRKAGKLPYDCYEENYALEYGVATMQMHKDAILKGKKVLIHDDLLATGGTALAAAGLVKNLGHVAGFSFLIDLEFLCGKQKLLKESENVFSLIVY
jgi:adenine phosphoribosyltransferase